MPMQQYAPVSVESSDEDLEVTADQDADKATAKGTSWPMAVAILINALIGAGVLTMPYGIMRSGSLAAGLSMEMLVGIIAWGSLAMLGWLGTDKGLHSMQDIVSQQFGKVGGNITAFIILLAYFLVCVSYVVAIRDQTSSIITDNFPLEWRDKWFLDAKFITTVIMCLIVGPFCFLPYIDQLKQMSTFAGVCVLCLAALVVAGFFDVNLQNPVYSNPAPLVDKINIAAPHLYAIFFGCASYSLAYASHPTAVLVYDSFAKKRLDDYLKATAVSSAVTMMFYNLVIIFAVITFGSKLQSHILLNYDSKNPYVLVASVSYMIKIMCEYVLLHFTARDGLLTLFKPCVHFAAGSKGECRWMALLTVIFIAISILLAFLMPHIMTVVHFNGISNISLMATIPAACLLQKLRSTTVKDELNAAQWFSLWVLGVCYIAFGILISGVSLRQGVIDIIDNN